MANRFTNGRPKINRKSNLSHLITPRTRGHQLLHNFDVDRFSGGFSPNGWNMTLLWHFPVLQSLRFMLCRSNVQLESHGRYSRSNNAVRLKNGPFGARMIADTVWGNVPQKSPRRASMDIFKPNWQNLKIIISVTIHPISPKFEDETHTINEFSRVLQHPRTGNTTWLTSVIVKIDVTSQLGHRRSHSQNLPCRWKNEMPMTNRSKSETEVDFQYGSRSFFQTGSSYNSDVDWDIVTKFGTVRDHGLLRTFPLSNWTGSWLATSTTAKL